MSNALASRTVGEWVADQPARSRVFERFQIDYCCGGKIPLEQACARKGVDLQSVLRELQAVDDVAPGVVDADAMGLTELADHIEQTHHAYLRDNLPRLEYLTGRVANAHGDKDSRLLELRQAFLAFGEEIYSHMAKEERILFPMIRQIELADGPRQFHCGSLANPIQQMEHEHDAAGDALARFHSLTDAFTPPAWACNTYRALVHALAELTGNMHQHVHKENNVLFPKALAREARLTQTAEA